MLKTGEVRARQSEGLPTLTINYSPGNLQSVSATPDAGAEQLIEDQAVFPGGNPLQFDATGDYDTGCDLPVATDPAAFIARALPLKGVATAGNVTDGAGAKAHVSSLAAAYFLLQNGIRKMTYIDSAGCACAARPRHRLLPASGRGSTMSSIVRRATAAGLLILSVALGVNEPASAWTRSTPRWI